MIAKLSWFHYKFRGVEQFTTQAVKSKKWQRRHLSNQPLAMRDQQERSMDMASSTGKRDKGNKEQRKKPKLSIKEKRKQKNEKKNK